MLEQKGYRVTSNREFFNAPLNEVIKIIVEAQRIFGNSVSSSSLEDDELLSEQTDDEFLDSFQITTKEPWEDIFSEANAYYYGLGEHLQDFAEAMKLYKQAAKLGATTAYFYLGTMYRRGEGCPKHEQKALDYFKEGARRGDSRCYAEMGILFMDLRHFENAKKSWKKYFESSDFLSEYSKNSWYGWIYYDSVRLYRQPLENVDALRKIKDKMLEEVREMIKVEQENNDASPEAISEYEKLIEDMKGTL